MMNLPSRLRELASSFFILTMTVLFVVGCQSPPTKVKQTMDPRFRKAAIKLEAGTVFLDARPVLDYDLGHLPQAIPVSWKDFSQKKEHFQGLLDENLEQQMRRLARYGIGPETPVVVIGNGWRGQGEEGRLAWTLQVMGIKNVRLMSNDVFNTPRWNQDDGGVKAHVYWDYEKDASLEVDKKTMLQASMSPHQARSGVVIIDVRTEREYLRKGSSDISKFAPDLGAINIPWNEFIDENGEVNFKLKEKLHEADITDEKKIYVIDEQGVKSALAVVALRRMGFNQAANFSGGYDWLMFKEVAVKTAVKIKKKSPKN